MTLVLDASALLAFLHDEPGADVVARWLDGAAISAVNWTEVIQKCLQRGVDVVGMREDLAEIGLDFEPFTIAQGEIAANLWQTTRQHGLSLADRACLALAIERKLPVLTADRVWAELGLGLDIRLLR